MYDSKLAYLAELMKDIPEEDRYDFYMRLIQATPDGFSPTTKKLLEERKKAVENSSYLTPPIRDTFRSPVRPIDANALLLPDEKSDKVWVFGGQRSGGKTLAMAYELMKKKVLDAPTLDIYLIFTDDMDDCCQIKGYILGTEEDADRCVEELDKKEPCWNGWTWQKLEQLN